MNIKQKKHKILLSFLKICNKSKIDNDLFSNIASDCDIKAAEIALIFENGITDIIDLYLSNNVDKLKSKIADSNDFDSKKIREKIYFCVFNFFELQKDNRQAVAAIKNFYFDLGNLVDKDNGLEPISYAVKSAYQLADKIWHILQDKSTDYNYYTKRLVLAKILSKAFFKFVGDDSKDLEATAQVISVEIDRVMQFEKFKKDFSNIAEISKEELSNMLMDSNKKMKPINEIVKNLPFIRLFN
tara:strand:+ start:110 stop:835 length:726 start_codon:yes stop_codon:yes gene_type:complete